LPVDFSCIKILLSASYPLNSYPNYFPALTNANSSGEAALY